MKQAMKQKVGYVNEGISIMQMRFAQLQIGEGSEVARGNIEGANIHHWTWTKGFKKEVKGYEHNDTAKDGEYELHNAKPLSYIPCKQM